MEARTLILGATGKIGTAWRIGAHGAFCAQPLLQSRHQKLGHLQWDVLNEPAPKLTCSGIVSLLGSTKEPARVQIALATRACDLADKLDVPLLIASTQAVYGVQDGPLSESSPLQPANAYGEAKARMEESVVGRRNVTCLRIGNVPGADLLFENARIGPVALDKWPDGQGPLRSMIGLVTLARVCQALLNLRQRPPILNVAQYGLVSMESLLAAADIDWHWTTAAGKAVQKVELDVSSLQNLVQLPSAKPEDLVKEAQICGAIK